jgi:hypothetical protein
MRRKFKEHKYKLYDLRARKTIGVFDLLDKKGIFPIILEYLDSKRFLGTPLEERIQNIVIMPYSGCMVQGKEVFEDDILKFHTVVGRVIFEDGSFVFKGENDPSVQLCLRHMLLESCEHLGNFYEHQGILKKYTQEDTLK